VIWETAGAILLSLGGGGAIVLGLSGWLGRVWAERLMERERADHSRELAQLRADLDKRNARDVEQLKSELQLQTQERVEAIRHELQKQLLRTQLAATKNQEVYSKLIQLLRKAEGAIGYLWGARFSPDYSRYSEDDLRQALEGANAPGQDKIELLDLLASDRRKEAIKKLESILRQRDKNEARKAQNEASNYLALEGIFMQRNVRDLAFEIARMLWHAWVDVDVGDQADPGQQFVESFNKNMKKVAALMPQLEDLMRAELLPASVEQPGLPSVVIPANSAALDPAKGAP
jgi:hypothetical protein